MGLFKGIGNLFKALDSVMEDEQKQQNMANNGKTPEEIAKEQKRQEEREKKRKCRRIQNQIDSMENEIEEMKEKAADFWDQAKDMMRQGQTQRANELVQAHDELQERISLKYRKALYFQKAIEKIKDGASDADIVKDLADYASQVNKDQSAEDIQEALDDLNDTLAEFEGANDVIGASLAKNAKKANRTRQSVEIKADEESMKRLKAEVLGEMDANESPSASSETVAETAAANRTQSQKSAPNSVEAEANAGLKETESLLDFFNKSKQ